MSRGLGRLQRKILRYLQDHPRTAISYLAADLYGTWPSQLSHAQLTSARRAVAGLKKAGLIVEGQRYGWWTRQKELLLTPVAPPPERGCPPR